jgi:hypothetical protein
MLTVSAICFVSRGGRLFDISNIVRFSGTSLLPLFPHLPDHVPVKFHYIVPSISGLPIWHSVNLVGNASSRECGNSSIWMPDLPYITKHSNKAHYRLFRIVDLLPAHVVGVVYGHAWAS